MLATLTRTAPLPSGRSFGFRSVSKQNVEFVEQHVVSGHVLEFADEGEDIRREGKQGEYRVNPDRYDACIDASSDDPCRHREYDCQRRGREDTGFELSCSQYEVASLGVRTEQILDLFACADEIEHRHALRENRNECRKHRKQEVLLQANTAVHSETHVEREGEASDSHQRAG